MSTLANLYADVKTLCQQWFYTKSEVDTALEELVDIIYPVGSIYMSTNSTDPSILFGGEWQQIQDKFLLAKGTTYNTLEGTGGEATHTLTTNEMPQHRHESSRRDVYLASGSATGLVGYSTSFTQTGVTSYSGGGQAHNNMPPYLIVNVWKRTA